MKKIYSLVLMTMLCAVTAWGENVAVALVGETTYYKGDADDAENHVYSTVNKAFTATVTDVANEGTIKLLNNVTGQITLGSGLDKTITFDLNGKTLTCTTGININSGSKFILVNTDPQNDGCINNTSTSTVYVSAIRCQANAEVVINNGVVVQTSGKLYTVYGYANSTITINGGTIKHTGATAKDVVMCDGGTLTINDGIIESTTKWDALYAKGGALVTINGGTIKNTSTGETAYAVDIWGNSTVSGDPIATTVTINGGSIVSNTAQKGYGISIWGNGATLNMTDGSISANNFAISGNGTVNSTTNYGGTTINISGGSLSSSAADAAIYHPQAGTLNITGGTITGKTGIGMKGGTLTISGGTIHAVGSNGGRVEGYNNGIHSSFAAVQIESNPGYAGNMSITVSGSATLISDSWYAFYEYLSNTESTTKVNSISVTGGNFQGGILLSQSLTARGGFVSGGKWSKDVSANVVAGKAANPISEDPYFFGVGDPTAATAEITNNEDKPAVLTNATNYEEVSEAVGGTKDVSATVATNSVVVSENTEVVAQGDGAASIVDVKKVTVSDDAQLTVTEGATLRVGAGAVLLEEDGKLNVEAGATLIVDGLIYGATEENLLIETSETQVGSILFSPETEFIREDNPLATVKMTAKQIGRDERGDFYWHRFAMPVEGIASWSKEGSLVGSGSHVVQYPTYVYAWDYDLNDWKNIHPNEMVPLQGYTLTLASDYIHVNGSGEVVSEGTDGGNLYTLQDVTYTFKGNLVGNANQPLNFTKEGFNFFGNSYTGYMHALTVLNGIVSGNVDATVYMWNSENQGYVGISRYKLEKNRGLQDWQREVAPMQTFILRLRGADSADESVDYASAIWGNPRYGNVAPAPRRMLAEEEEDAYLEIKVTSANGKYDVVDFTEMASKTDAYEDSYDSEKYMNQKSINFYSTIGDMNFSSVVTNNLLGKTLSLQTMEETDYTLSFEYVEGKEYALRDKVTNDVIAITNDATYSFTAQPNATNENRFEIVSINEVPTAVENVETASKPRGIYTVLGQYVGEDFNALPAGVYIVNGVKIVK